MKTATVHVTIPSLVTLVVVVNIAILAILGALWETQDLWLPEALRPWLHDAQLTSLEVATPVSSSALDSAIPDADLRRQYHDDLLLLVRSLSQLAARDSPSEGSSNRHPSSTSDSSPGLEARQLFGPARPTQSAQPATGGTFLSGLAGLVGLGDLGSDLAGTGLFLGVGLGSGAAQGLNLSEKGAISASASRAVKYSGKEATGLNPAVQSAAEGAAATLLGALSPPTGGVAIGPAAMALGTGIGNGTAIGLGLRSAVPAAAAAGQGAVGIPEAVGLFGLGLSSSAVGSVNITQLARSAGGGSLNLMAMLPAAASGLGKGFGAGIPVGLGLQPEQAINPSPATTNGQVDPGMVAQMFAYGLTSQLLANGTVSKLRTASAGLGLGMGNVDIGLAAQGLSRGLLQGAGDAVESVGGIEALINGNARAPAGGVPNTTVEFNDSIGGAAVGLGTGFGSQGVLVARQLLAGMSQGPGVARRHTQLVSRQAPVPAVPDTGFNFSGFNLSTFVNDRTVSIALQVGVDALTCEGVGGLLGVLLGLKNGGAIPTSIGGDQTLQKIVPPGTFRFRNSGNSYEVDGQQVVGALSGSLLSALGGITINGRSGAAFVAFAVVHILIAVLFSLLILPFAMGLESSRNILLRLRLPKVLPNAERWSSILWFIVLAPSLVIVFVFGSLLIGSTTHFRSVHSILGIVTTIVGYVAVVFHFISVKYLSQSDIELKSTFLRHGRIIRILVNQLFLFLSVATSLLGFNSLSGVALCAPQVLPFAVSLSFGFGLAGLVVLGASLSGFDMYLGLRYLRKRKQLAEKGNQRSP